MHQIMRNIREDILSLVYTIAVTTYTLSAFFGSVMVGVFPGVVIFCILNYVVFFYCKRLGKTGSLVFILYSLSYLLLLLTMMKVFQALHGGGYFLSWFFRANPSQVDAYIGFWFIALLAFSYYYSSTIFYFTIMKYRVPVLLMISYLALLIVSSKTNGHVNVFFVLFAISFFMLYIDRTRKQKIFRKMKAGRVDQWYLASMGVLIVLTLIASIVIPKPSKIPKLAYLDQVVLPIGATIQSVLISTGGTNQIFNPRNRVDGVISPYAPNLSNRIIMELEGSEAPYLRLQTWNYYTPNRWTSVGEEVQIERNLDERRIQEKKFSVLVKAIEKVIDKSDVAFPQEVVEAFRLEDRPREKMQLDVDIKGLILRDYLSVPGIIDIESTDSNEELFNGNLKFFPKNATGSLLKEYSLKYYTQKIGRKTRQQKILGWLNKADYEMILEKLRKAKDQDQNDIVTQSEKQIFQESLNEL
jgi:hypothetical protein